MNTYTINQFIVNIALLDEQVIYLKVIDNTSFSTYERNCEIRDFPNAESIEDTYKLITNCFDGAENHSCLFYAKVNMLQIAVNAKFGGYYTVKYDVYLKERISADQKCNAICARLVALEQPELKLNTDIRQSLHSLTNEVQLLGVEMCDMRLNHAAEINSLKTTISELNSNTYIMQHMTQLYESLNKIASPKVSPFKNIENKLFSNEETMKNIDLLPSGIRNMFRELVSKYKFNIRRGNLNNAQMVSSYWETTIYTDTKLTIFMRQSGQLTASYTIGKDSVGSDQYGNMDNSGYNKFNQWVESGGLRDKYINPHVYVDYLMGCTDEEIESLMLEEPVAIVTENTGGKRYAGSFLK